MDSFQISEIYASVQGESSYAGFPCTFVRLTGCPLRCRWCDTSYAFSGGENMSLPAILEKVESFGLPLVEITGGEPLAQQATPKIVRSLQERGYRVLIETSGSELINQLSPETHIIMDIKCPGSQMDSKNLWENVNHLKKSDEIKFVIADQNDFQWSLAKIQEFDLSTKANLLFSPAFGLLQPQELVRWMLESKVRARLNLQQHKYIWSPRKKGV